MPDAGLRTDPEKTWDFHVGGYQVVHKWLKDRAAKGGSNPSIGRVLTDEDTLHYRRGVVALTETRRLMAEIDKVIEEYGGWPEAFYVPPPLPPTIEEIIQADDRQERIERDHHQIPVEAVAGKADKPLGHQE